MIAEVLGTPTTETCEGALSETPSLCQLSTTPFLPTTPRHVTQMLVLCVNSHLRNRDFAWPRVG